MEVQPTTFDERTDVANRCQQSLDIAGPMLIDLIDDKVCKAYSGFPDRLYIIDLEGKVAYKSGRGPFGYKPLELEQSLVLMLREAAEKSEE